MEDTHLRRATIGIMIAWFVFATLVDRFVLREWTPWLSNLLYFRDAKIIIKPFERDIS